MQNGRLIIRHAIVSLVSLLLFIALNHSSVLLISRLGSVTWYPATGFVLALYLGISPWYAVLVCIIGVIPGVLFYHQPSFPLVRQSGIWDSRCATELQRTSCAALCESILGCADAGM